MNEQGTYRGFGDPNKEGTSNFASGGSGLGLGLTLLLVGLGIGAATALLLAPDTGRKTRKKLRRRYEDTRDMLGDLGDQANDAWERGSDWANDKWSKGSDWAVDTRKRAAKFNNKRVRPIRKSIFG